MTEKFKNEQRGSNVENGVLNMSKCKKIKVVKCWW
jgi:hypothetical protein